MHLVEMTWAQIGNMVHLRIAEDLGDLAPAFVGHYQRTEQQIEDIGGRQHWGARCLREFCKVRDQYTTQKGANS